MPCRWLNDKIVVMDEVLITSPYQPENCTAVGQQSGNLELLNRVKIVVNRSIPILLLIAFVQLGEERKRLGI